MNDTLTHTLSEWLVQHTGAHKGILPASILAGMQDIAGTFPVVSTIGYKYHLNAPWPRTGLMMRLRHDAPYLDDFLKEYTALGSKHAWPVIAGLFRQPIKYTGAGQVENVWLNFDTRNTRKMAPGIFFDVDCTGRPGTAACLHSLNLSLKRLGRPPVAGENEFIAGLLDTTHKPLVQYAGIIPGALPALRLCFSNLHSYNVWPFLRETYGNNINPFRNRTKHLVEHAAKLVVHMDLINGRPGDNAGIEVHLEEAEKWNDFFEHLVADGLCSEKENENIKAFTGNENIAADKQAHYLSMTTGNQTRTVHRRLSHVKLDYNPQTGVTAKAYLHAGYR